MVTNSLQSKKLSIDERLMHFQQLATEIQQIKDWE